MDELQPDSAGLDRRTLIKRGAVVGGTLVWATPVVQSITRPAFAAVSAAGCSARVEVERTLNGVTSCTCTAFASQPPTCCECIDAVVAQTGNAAFATIVCFGSGACLVTSPSPCTCS